MSSSGKGQSVVTRADDVRAAWEYAGAGSRVNQGKVIVEGFVEFDYEITLLTVRAVGASGAVETYFCEPIGHVQVKGDYVESWQPQPMSPAALEKSRAYARAVTDDLGGRGIFGVELFVRGDDVWFSEVSPRPHDTGLVTLCTQRLSEFELHARAILGLPVNVSLRRPGASAVIYGGSKPRASPSRTSKKRSRSPRAICACSASPNRSHAAAWALRSRTHRRRTRPASARNARPRSYDPYRRLASFP